MTEMEKALQADGEKLLALTGQDHGPFTLIKDEFIAQMPTVIEEKQTTGCIWCDGGIRQWIEAPGRAPEHLISDPDGPTEIHNGFTHTICGNFVPCTRKN